MSRLNELTPKSFSFNDILKIQEPEIIKVEWVNIDERRIISPIFIESLPVKSFKIVNTTDFTGQVSYPNILLLTINQKTEIIVNSKTLIIEPYYVLALPAFTSFFIKNQESQLYLIELDSNSHIDEFTAQNKKDLFEIFTKWLHYIDNTQENLAEVWEEIINNLYLWELKIATLYENSLLADHSHSQVNAEWIDNDYEMFTVRNGRAVFLMKEPNTDNIYYYKIEPGKLLIIKPGWSHLAYVEKNTSLIGIKWEPYTFGITDKEIGIHFQTRLTDEEQFLSKNWSDDQKSSIKNIQEKYEFNKNTYKEKMLEILRNWEYYWKFE